MTTPTLPGIPPNMSLAAAISAGLIPRSLQLTGYGAGLPNPTIASLESAASTNLNLDPALPASTIVPVLTAPVQSALGTNSVGGTIANGVYFAKVTAVTLNGESTGSNERTVTAAAANTSTITVTWSAVLGALSYKVYLTAAGGGAGNENVFATVAGSSLTTTLTAAPASSGTPPLATNPSFGGPI